MKRRKIFAVFIMVVFAFLISISFFAVETYAANEDDEEWEYLDSVEDYAGSKPSENDIYGGFEYLIDSYDINIVVNENNRLDITETLVVYFNVPKHGIYRTIPLKNTVKRLDGSTSKNRTQVTNIKVDNEYKKERENGKLKLKIGSPNYTVEGAQLYTISYTYNLGKDPVKDYDELYFNIIGTEWEDTIIGNITFTITMPKEFDATKLGFSSGYEESTENENVYYSVDGNVITGGYNGILEPKQALTVRCELPEGYFVGAGLDINVRDYIMFAVPIVFLIISILIWYIFGRDDKVIETVEFYPPEGFNSLEVGFMYKGKADNQDVVSLLIYLANAGYLKIAETEEKSFIFKKKGFRITKLKEYDGNNANEKVFMDGLFKLGSGRGKLIKDGEEYDGQLESVTGSDLYNSFYRTVNTILKDVNDKENKNKIFEIKASKKQIFITLMIMASFVLITIPPIFTYGEPFMFPFALLFPGIGFSVMFAMVFGKNHTVYVNGKPKNSSVSSAIFGIIWGLGFGGIPWCASVLPSLLQDKWYLIGYLAGLLCILGMVLCKIYLPKRTPYGNMMLGKIRGFKNFLQVAEKEKLEALVLEQPDYFYNILPFTYVLGVSDKWIQKFETIAIQAPSWYDGYNFDTVAFGNFMNSTMAAASTAMTSSPSGSSGGSSGGGSSGGGSGGGGGGSW